MIKKIINKIFSLLIFGGLDKETYHNVKSRINDENRKSVSIFGILGGIAFLITGISAVLHHDEVNPIIYFVAVGVLFLMIALNEILKKKFPKISDFFAIVFSIILLTFGILIAFNQSNERTTMLLPLFTLVSLVFCYRPIYMVVILTGVEVAYLIVMKSVQDPELFFINMVNSLIFCFIGMVGGFYTLIMKHKKYKAEYQNLVLAERDALTGLLNRYSCMQELNEIVKRQKPVTICSFDVNGLKRTNDTKGHLAGDELIIGAAEVIKEVFGDYGKVYRVGGDEFAVIIYKEFDEVLLRSQLIEKSKQWNGKLCHELSIAVGMAKLDHDYAELIDSTIHLADVQMYKEKREYHQAHEEHNGNE